MRPEKLTQQQPFVIRFLLQISISPKQSFADERFIAPDTQSRQPDLVGETSSWRIPDEILSRHCVSGMPEFVLFPGLIISFDLRAYDLAIWETYLSEGKAIVNVMPVARDLKVYFRYLTCLSQRRIRYDLDPFARNGDLRCKRLINGSIRQIKENDQAPESQS